MSQYLCISISIFSNSRPCRGSYEDIEILRRHFFSLGRLRQSLISSPQRPIRFGQRFDLARVRSTAKRKKGGTPTANDYSSVVRASAA